VPLFLKIGYFIEFVLEVVYILVQDALCPNRLFMLSIFKVLSGSNSSLCILIFFFFDCRPKILLELSVVFRGENLLLPFNKLSNSSTVSLSDSVGSKTRHLIWFTPVLLGGQGLHGFSLNYLVGIVDKAVLLDCDNFVFHTCPCLRDLSTLSSFVGVGFLAKSQISFKCLLLLVEEASLLGCVAFVVRTCPFVPATCHHFHPQAAKASLPSCFYAYFCW
jgi:hypothetical protein